MRNLKSIPNPIEQALILDVEHDLIHLSYLLLPFLSPFFLAQALARAIMAATGVLLLRRQERARDREKGAVVGRRQ
jgi:hypothetical protein